MKELSDTKYFKEAKIWIIHPIPIDFLSSVVGTYKEQLCHRFCISSSYQYKNTEIQLALPNAIGINDEHLRK